ncbi:hypothetical protein EVAR_91282_1 [Eumeta japonica]|uniref:RNA-directed DNA polymerase n=1 Tax=Eumeta variegata TaxID=151549 RepID=A0A4C1TF95_EUMVA|nr:hypothetical protein EVAR_91282_1 [Eumeta japonica]
MKFKKITFGDIDVYGLVDTGCVMCIIRCDVYEKLRHRVNFIEDKVCLRAQGYNIFVARGEDIRYPAILGNNLLRFVDLMVSEKEVRFIPKIYQVREVISNEYREEAANIGKQKRDGFITEFASLCMHFEEVSMKILVKDDIPVAQRPRRVSHQDQQIIDEQISEWLDKGIIKQSMSEYSSPVVLVPKKDGSKRLCCDYRKLNGKIIRDNFPMALIDDVVEKLQGANVFTTLDLKDGFFHVPVDSESTKYTAFVTHGGQYEFCYVPFGISNSPAVFCRFINVIFRDLIRKGMAVVYMDDVIIPSRDEEEGIERLKMVLSVAEENGLRVRWKKCQFLQRKVNFLGYIIEKGTIRPSKDKTIAIENFPLPHDKKSLQRFLGLTSYFRRFVEGYATIAKPLSDLLRKENKFELKEEALSAFQQLKLVLMKDPVLKLFNVNAITEVHTDASKFGYGAVLMQKDSKIKLYIQYNT